MDNNGEKRAVRKVRIDCCANTKKGMCCLLEDSLYYLSILLSFSIYYHSHTDCTLTAKCKHTYYLSETVFGNPSSTEIIFSCLLHSIFFQVLEILFSHCASTITDLILRNTSHYCFGGHEDYSVNSRQ